jgi:hypothetical protein
MKKHHTTVVLAILFLTLLSVFWWASDTEIDREESDAILPSLARVQVGDIKRVEILKPHPDAADAKPEAAKDEEKEKEKGKDEGQENESGNTNRSSPEAERLVFERREEGRWQMVEPLNVAADPSLVETLVRNLREIRKSGDSGTIHDPPGTFGLAPPGTTVRLFGRDAKTPLAGLDVGRTVREKLYIRPERSTGIEVVDYRLLSAVRSTVPVKWRDKALFHLPSFRVGALSVTGPGRDLKVERDEGHWRLTRPFRAVGEGEKVEGMVAELSSLRVANGDAGFVANDVAAGDAARYGLDPAALTIELRPSLGAWKPQTLLVGKAESESSTYYYARTGDQDDVVLIDAKPFIDLGLDPNALRSKQVADVTSARVEFLRLEAFGREFDVCRKADGWELIQPARAPADAVTVVELLKQLTEAQTSEFLDAARIPNPGLDPPQMTLTVWQSAPEARPALGLDKPPDTAPWVVLQVGRYDVARKVLYARLEGDRSVLAIPETFFQALPPNPLAFKDRTVLTLGPTQIHTLTIQRGATTIALAAPIEAGKSPQWRMTEPVAAAADPEAVTRVVMLLSKLRADSYVTDAIGDGKSFGFDAPALTVSWTTPGPASASSGPKEPAPTTGTLRIGKKLPKSELSYANIAGSPVVFTLGDKVLELFNAEFHTHRVLSFKAESARRLVLRWPGRTLRFKPQVDPARKVLRWVPEPDPEHAQAHPGFDTSRVTALVAFLANLTTPKFFQYEGPLPVYTGLTEPRLVIEVEVSDSKAPRVLRLGRSTPEQTLATTAQGDSGPVFVLTGPAWSDLVLHVPGSGEFPDDVFAPEPARAKQP